jgi:hypothetical protein
MNEVDKAKLDNIITMFKDIRHGSDKKISREMVLDLMKNDDIEVKGVVYNFCTNSDYYINIEPNLTEEDYYHFIKDYLRRCLIENPSGEWTETRYEAGWSFVNWFKSYWKNKSLERDYASELKEWLAEIYVSGDDDVRLCISTSILEHIFDKKGISKFFSDWRNDPVLKQAFEEAMGCAGKIKGPS